MLIIAALNAEVLLITIKETFLTSECAILTETSLRAQSLWRTSAYASKWGYYLYTGTYKSVLLRQYTRVRQIN